MIHEGDFKGKRISRFLGSEREEEFSSGRRRHSPASKRGIKTSHGREKFHYRAAEKVLFEQVSTFRKGRSQREALK